MLLDITEIIVTSQILKCVYRNQNRKGVIFKCQLHFCRRFSTFPLNLFAEFTLVLSIFPKILHIFHAVHRIFVSLATCCHFWFYRWMQRQAKKGGFCHSTPKKAVALEFETDVKKSDWFESIHTKKMYRNIELSFNEWRQGNWQ